MMGSTKDLINEKNKDVPPTLQNKTLVLVAVTACFLLIVTGLVALVLYISLSSNNHPEARGLKEERSVIINRKDSEQQNEINRAMIATSWISETANRPHVSFYNPGFPKTPADFKKGGPETTSMRTTLLSRGKTTQRPLKGKESNARNIKFSQKPKRQEKSKMKHLKGDGSISNNPKIKERHLIKTTKITPKIHKGATYDFTTEQGQDEAENKMARRMRRQAAEIATSENKDGPCVDKTFGFYPDYAMSCKVFYLCLRGKQRTFLCPPGKVFDRRSLDCVGESLNKTVCKPRQMKCTDKAIHFYPDYQSKCKRFFMCLNSVTHYYACPNNMAFSPNLLACVPKTLYNCTDPYLAYEVGFARIQPIIISRETSTLLPQNKLPTNSRPVFQNQRGSGDSGSSLVNKASSFPGSKLNANFLPSQNETPSTNQAANQNPFVYHTVERRLTTESTVKPEQVIRGKYGSKKQSSGLSETHNPQKFDGSSTIYHGFIYTKPIRVHNIPVAHSISDKKHSIESTSSTAESQPVTELHKNPARDETTQKLKERTAMDVLVIVKGKPCNGSTYRPDYSSNCRKFFWCVRGQERLYTCPKNKKFSAQLEKCTNPQNVTCESKASSKTDVNSTDVSLKSISGTWLTAASPRFAASGIRPRGKPSRWRINYGDKIKTKGLVVRRTEK